MKNEVLKILELLEKGVITSEEANALIQEIKNSDDSSNSYKEQEEKSSDTKKNYYDSKKFEEGLKSMGDTVNDFITKVQPDVLKATRALADKIAESSRKFSEKVDSKINDEPKNKQEKSTSEVDDIINNYEEENDHE